MGDRARRDAGRRAAATGRTIRCGRAVGCRALRCRAGLLRLTVPPARADAQLDETWRRRLAIGFDVLDVPRQQFITASDAWQQCRAGILDPERFGIEYAGLPGLWFIAGSLVRDLAALNRVETLPWDSWGAQPRPAERLGDEALALFDRVARLTRESDARLTREPDDHFDAMRTLCQEDARLRVPWQVFNALRQCAEPAR